MKEVVNLRDLNKYAYECMHEFDLIDIPYNVPEKWKVSGNMVRSYGNCKTTRKLTGETVRVKEIAINKRLLDEEIPDIILKNTIAHELIHTIDYCGNHGTEFKKYAKIVSENLGYNIGTYVSREENEIVSRKYAGKEKKYFIFCPNCGWEYGYKIKAAAWKRPQDFYCGKCGSEIKRKEV